MKQRQLLCVYVCVCVYTRVCGGSHTLYNDVLTSETLAGCCMYSDHNPIEWVISVLGSDHEERPEL